MSEFFHIEFAVKDRSQGLQFRYGFYCVIYSSLFSILVYFTLQFIQMVSRWFYRPEFFIVG